MTEKSASHNSLPNKERVRAYEERTGLLLNEGCEGALDVTRAARIQD